MLRYLGRRLLATVPILLGVMAVAFGLINAMPGDPVSMMLNPNAMDLTSSAAQAQRLLLGLDQPLPVRFLLWLREAAMGNLGYSAATGEAVLPLVLSRFVSTAELAGPALLVAVLLAIALGTVAATHQGGRVDYSLTGLGVLSVSLPSFFLGLGGIYLFSLRLGWLPTAGKTFPGEAPSFGGFLLHLVLPCAVLALLTTAELMRYVRASLLDVLGAPFLKSARAKGLRPRRILFAHALRNGLLPLITVVGTRVPQLLGGAVITETIFQWPGAGMLSVNAIAGRDYPVLMGVLLLSAVVVLGCNLLTDLLYARADPRVRLGALDG